MHIDRLTGDQMLTAAVNFEVAGHACPAQAGNTHPDIDHVVETGRRVIVDDGLHHVEMLEDSVTIRVAGAGQRFPVLGECNVEVRQIVSVEDHALHVHLGPPHP